MLRSREILALVLVAGCGHASPPLANHGGPAAGDRIRAIDWQNHTYDLSELGSVTVRQGHADFEITDDYKVVASGGTPGMLDVDPPVFADLDGDGQEEAVIRSTLATGGTGHFSEVRVFALRGGAPVELADIAGGDRGDGGIRKVVADGAALLVDRNVLAPGDGICCASRYQRERWTWQHGELVKDDKLVASGPVDPTPSQP